MRKLLFLILVVLLTVPDVPGAAAGAKKKSPPPPAAAKAKPEPVNVLESCSRMLTFDPHPNTFNLANPVTVDGQSYIGEVTLAEKWESKKDKGMLRELGVSLRLLKEGTEAQRLEIPAVKLAEKKPKAGVLLGEAKGNGVGLLMSVESLTGSAKAISELVVTLKVIGLGPVPPAATPALPPATPAAPALATTTTTAPATPTAPIPLAPTGSLTSTETASPPVAAATPAPAAATAIPSSGLKMALKMAEKAAAMQAGQEAAKAQLLKRALSLIPDSDVSPEAEAFRAETGKQLTDLATAAPASAGTPTGASPAAPVEGKPAVDPQAQGWYQEAVKRFQQGQEPEARDLLRKAVEKAPDYYEAWALLGKNAYENSRHAKAKEALEKALALKENDFRSAGLYFKSCYYLGDAEAGLEKLRAMVARNPKAAEVRMILAEALFQAGDLPGCEAECQHLLADRPGDARALDLLARTQARMR